MGICCSIRRMDNSLQHGLRVNDESDDMMNQNDNILMHEHESEQIQQGNDTSNNNVIGTITSNNNNDSNNNPAGLPLSNESSLNTMSVTVSHFTDHPIQNNEDEDDDEDDDEDNILYDNDQKNDDNDEEDSDENENENENDGNSRYKKLLNKMNNRKMRKRKNLKSFLTEIRKTKEKQLMSKKKKLKELLLDRNNEKEYNEAFEPHITPNAPHFKKLTSRSVFPEISFTEWIIKQGVELNDIINEVFNTPPDDSDDDEEEENDEKKNEPENDNDKDNDTSSVSSESSPASADTVTNTISTHSPSSAKKYGSLFVGYIPEEISVTIIQYTLDLLPGIYEFEGSMDYNGTDDEDDEYGYGGLRTRGGWGMYMGGYGGGNRCTCQIILNSRAEIIGGHFSENSFKYHITNGTYTYEKPYCIEFTKEYFNYNYKYKVYGSIDRDIDENLQFKGYWKLLNGSRGGHVKMRYKGCQKGAKQNEKLVAGKYQFYGHCDYLPNTSKREFFTERQRIKSYLTLNDKDYRIKGHVKLLRSSGYTGYRRRTLNTLWIDLENINNENVMESDSSDDDENNIFEVDEKESEWDMYGGLHIQLMNGYIMEGFFNGEDFMGVWKDDQFNRFGHFQYEIFTEQQDNDKKKNRKRISTRGMNINEDDDDQDENNNDDEKEDVLLSSTYDLTRAKSLDSEEDIHEQHQEEDID